MGTGGTGEATARQGRVSGKGERQGQGRLPVKLHRVKERLPGLCTCKCHKFAI